jgi:hypothetical protein
VLRRDCGDILEFLSTSAREMADARKDDLANYQAVAVARRTCLVL